MEMAFPTVVSTSNSTAENTQGPGATSKRRGIWVRNFSMAISFVMPITDSLGPTMPTSVR